MLPSLELALHAPERRPYIKKLRNFLADHGLEAVPTLVMQCASVEPCVVDTMAPRMDNTLLQGIGHYSEGSWWNGFAGGTRKTGFDGFASVHSADEPLWAAEIQDDGQILAAVRALAYSEMAGVHPGILNAFADFAALTQQLRSATGTSGAVQLTAMLVNAKDLQLLSFAGYSRTKSRGIGRETVEWPVLTAGGPEEIAAVCEQMRVRFKRMFP